jgi:hypothetical protein
MYTWVLRTAPFCVFVLAALASCAGDDDAPPAGCTPNMSSLSMGLSGSSNDPCGSRASLTMSPCNPDKKLIAYATCNAQGTGWITDPATGSVQCGCMACGNGQVDMIPEFNYREECDGLGAVQATCAQLVGNGSTGTVRCTNSCTFDKTMCTPPSNMMTGATGG